MQAFLQILSYAAHFRVFMGESATAGDNYLRATAAFVVEKRRG